MVYLLHGIERPTTFPAPWPQRYELAELLIKYGVSKTGSMANVRPGLSAESGLNRPLDLSLDVSLSQRLLKHARVRGATEYLADTVK